MAGPPVATTEWVPIWNPMSQGPVGPQGPTGPTGGGSTGTGTAGVLTKWLTGTSIGNSIMSESGTVVTLSATAATVLAVTSTTNDTTSRGLIQLLAGGGTYGEVGSYCANYTTAGTNIAASTRFYGGGTGGVSLQAGDAAGVIRLYTGGSTERMRITAAGNVGIGTVTPYAKLSVIAASSTPTDVGSHFELATGTGAYPGDSRLAMGVNDGVYAYILTVKPGTAYLNLVLQPAAGNVGIGTTAPKSALHVGTPRDSIALTLQNVTGDTAGGPFYVGLMFADADPNAAGNRSQIRSYSNLYNAWGTSLVFYTTASTGAGVVERMRLQPNGGVVIGNTSDPTTGALATGGGVRAMGWFAAGVNGGNAMEMGMSGGQGYIICYNRDTSAYVNGLNIGGGGQQVKLGGPLAQAGSYYMFPGAVTGEAFQANWYLGSHSSYGLYANTGMCLVGGVWCGGTGIMQKIGAYLYPGSISGYADYQTSYYIASHSGYTGLYTNGGFAVMGQLYVGPNAYVGNHLYAGWQTGNSSRIGFYIDTSVYLINDTPGRLVISANNALMYYDGTYLFCTPDGARVLGHPSYRWNQFYTYNINTINAPVVSSDGRLKRDVRPTIYGSAFLAALRPVDYAWLDPRHGAGRSSGLIAQDVAASAPTFGGVTYGDDGVASGLRYTSFIAPLVAGWQDHEARLVALEQQPKG